MASLSPFPAPNSGGKPWVEQISKTLKEQLAIKLDTPPLSIFEVPKTLKDEKTEAYTPQKIGMGPKHHFQTELYERLEQNKLSSVKRVLKTDQYYESEDEVVAKVKEIIPIISACYDKPLDADEDTLAWLFAIDGLFLINILGAFADGELSIEAKDLIMLENQIPLIVLKEIQKALSVENPHAKEDYLESKFKIFCESFSPFLLSEEKIKFDRVNHLLGYMYHSIINNQSSISGGVNFIKPGSVSPQKDAGLELLDSVIQLAGVIPGAKPFIQILESIRKDFSEIVEERQKVVEINVPSVSKLQELAKVKFQLSPRNGGIRNITFVQTEEERSLNLPKMTLNFDSEVILRNLVAYEKLMARNSITGGFGLEITEYVDFLCGIIDNDNDVSLLREEKIIEGNMRDTDIVKMFNGIGRSLGNRSVDSELRRTVAELNKVYESNPSVQLQKMAENQVRTSAKAITYLVSISGTLFLMSEAYSKVNGSNSLLQTLSENLGSFSSLIPLG